MKMGKEIVNKENTPKLPCMVSMRLLRIKPLEGSAKTMNLLFYNIAKTYLLLRFTSKFPQHDSLLLISLQFVAFAGLQHG